ncbi:nitrilase-related carbon-nitrogen hydrolase [Marinicellulosiphila megalodicopiae]|uniref:nitrilase-related carbon-nitrogen hydrolase n=1 Tax=Marinicellulosiphila megalodicopiae TaxID=2724896 RepID=UPI003BB17198
MIRFSVVQMTSTNDVSENFNIIKTLLTNQKMDVLVLPEMCLSIGAKYKSPVQMEFDQVLIELSQLAIENNALLIAGTVKQPQTNSDKGQPNCYVFDQLGQIVTCYQKIHLFDAVVNDTQGAYRESDQYDPGSLPCVFDFMFNNKVIKMGLAVCYDLRFSLLFHELKKQGAQLIVVPAAFVYKTGDAHWEVLLRARAIEFGVYILACNQTGWHDETRHTFGHSMLINPWGEVVNTLGEEVGLLNCDIEENDIIHSKELLPSFNHVVKFD